MLFQQGFVLSISLECTLEAKIKATFTLSQDESCVCVARTIGTQTVGEEEVRMKDACTQTTTAVEVDTSTQTEYPEGTVIRHVHLADSVMVK